ncbi:MAG: metallophosphoesterase family protein [Candidatus Staskawiczbacteria bacterium]|jgi:predicted phosphodiesterase
MIIGLISDTHEDNAGALPHIIKELRERGVELIIHCGDIEPKHLSSEVFLDIPVVCALNAEQVEKPAFRTPPRNWELTKPGERVVDIGDIRCYVGHKMSFDFLTGSELEFSKKLNEIRRDHDGLRWVFAGHTHHQILFQTQLVTFINPGAISDSYDGYEFAVIDTKNDEIVFGRIPKTKPLTKPFSVGVISDSLKISQLDIDFWQKLAEEFHRRDVSRIIHCGNIAEEDIGRPELNDFEVFYNLRDSQTNSANVPDNWHLIDPESPLVDINGYQFFIQLGLARKLLDESEVGMHKYILSLKERFPFVSFILFGCSRDTFMEEQDVRIINPGDVARSRNFAVICLPRAEITFGHVPIDPLPNIEEQV